MTHLNDIPVQFDQEQHKYYDKRTGRELKGITSTLLRRLFPNKYKDVPQFVLQKAADKGSIVHEDIELTETLGTEPSTQEGKNYLQLKNENGLTFLASEHLVSDMESYASSIDLVFDVEDNIVDIADIKTTYKFDKEILPVVSLTVKGKKRGSWGGDTVGSISASKFAQALESAVPEFFTNAGNLMLVTAAVGGVIMWSIIHSVFVKPFVLVGVLRNYIASGKDEKFSESDFDELDKKSAKFKKLHAEA